MKHGDDIIASLHGVYKTYDGVQTVVEALDLDVHRHEFLTLLGPSGSGKTTTLMMIAGFETPTAGEITLGGRVIQNVPPHQRNIGMVFQSYALFPHMNVANNLAYPLRRRGWTRSSIEEAVSAALAMVRLSHLGERFPAQLSGGQQQRVALARALIFKPDMVLMDEPLGALDRNLREEMQSEIRNLHSDLGMTVLYVTHDQDEALSMSDRIAVFNKGEVRQLGSAREIYDEPENLFVAGFVGDNNTFGGIVTSQMPQGVTISAGGTQLVARSRGKLVPGSPVTVCLRPEDIIVNDAPAGQIGSWIGQLKELVYLGDHAKLVVEVADIGRLLVKTSVQFSGSAGDLVPLSVTPGRPIAFAAERIA